MFIPSLQKIVSDSTAEVYEYFVHRSIFYTPFKQVPFPTSTLHSIKTPSEPSTVKSGINGVQLGPFGDEVSLGVPHNGAPFLKNGDLGSISDQSFGSDDPPDLQSVCLA